MNDNKNNKSEATKAMKPRYFYCKDCAHTWKDSDTLVQNAICSNCSSKRVKMVKLVERKG